jgi:hypothetical protein
MFKVARDSFRKHIWSIQNDVNILKTVGVVEQTALPTENALPLQFQLTA